jgi:hypothetical protein
MSDFMISLKYSSSSLQVLAPLEFSKIPFAFHPLMDNCFEVLIHMIFILKKKKMANVVHSNTKEDGNIYIYINK